MAVLFSIAAEANTQLGICDHWGLAGRNLHMDLVLALRKTLQVLKYLIKTATSYNQSRKDIVFSWVARFDFHLRPSGETAPYMYAISITRRSFFFSRFSIFSSCALLLNSCFWLSKEPR